VTGYRLDDGGSSLGRG